MVANWARELMYENKLKKKVIKKTNISTDSVKESKTSNSMLLSENVSWADFMEGDAQRFFPGKDQWRRRLIHTLLTWADQEDSLELMQFCVKYKIPYRTFHNWLDRFPDLKEVFDQVKLMLGSRRRVGATHNKYNLTMILRDLHHYDPGEIDINAYNDKRKLGESEIAKTQVVIIERYPELKIENRDPDKA